MIPRKDPEFEKRVLEILRTQENSWSGCIDSEALAKQIHDLALERGRSLLAKEKIAKVSKEEPSEAFEDVFSSHAGTIAATCELCGRFLYTEEVLRDGEEGEFEKYEALRKRNPDKYILMDYDSVSLAEIDHQQVVLGCPCNGLRRYEDFVWRERRGIAEYMQQRLLQAQKQLKELKEQVENITEGSKL